MKFKVIKLSWAYSFKPFFKFDEVEGWTPEDYYQDELKAYKKSLKNKPKNIYDHYDGPLKYIEECEDPGFPPRENVQYCVRLQGTPSCTYWKPYQCYCYQVGKWWKFKDISHLFTEVHVPRMSEYSYNKLHCPFKYLAKQYQVDFYFHRHSQELRQVGREAQLFTRSCLKDID